MKVSLTRRQVIPVLGGAAAVLSLSANHSAASPAAMLGAIRWDPWYSHRETPERAAVEATLGPAQYQGRAPEFATRTSDNEISIDGQRQSQIDREIILARDAGLAFWAYVFYDFEMGMMNAWHMHQASVHRESLNWCMVVSSRFVTTRVAREPGRFVALLRQMNYQKVLGGRPLIFLLDDGTASYDLRGIVERFRQECFTAAVGNPYFAVMSWVSDSTRDLMRQIGADAISAYSVGHPLHSASFEALDRVVRKRWDAMRATGAPCVPLAVTGDDPRPRISTPVPWESAQDRSVDKLSLYYAAGLPKQIAAEVRAMADWIEANPLACPAQCGVIYSWDECDEGGSTLLPTLGEGSAVLQALAAALNP